MPKISICIPVYNGEKYIERTIKSALKQTFEDFELVICDNDSTDATIDLVRKFEDPRIRLIRNKKNVGMAGNWNACLRQATGEYIHMLCADDILKPDALFKLLEGMEQKSGVVISFSGSEVIDENDKFILKRRPFRGNRYFDGVKFARKSFRSRNIYGEPSNIMFTKKACRMVGEYEECLPYSPDWEYSLRLSVQGKVCYIDDTLMQFRISKSSETNNLFKNNSKIIEDDKILIDRLKQIPELHIGACDVLLHRMSMKLRSIAKIVFLRLILKEGE